MQLLPVILAASYFIIGNGREIPGGSNFTTTSAPVEDVLNITTMSTNATAPNSTLSWNFTLSSTVAATVGTSEAALGNETTALPSLASEEAAEPDYSTDYRDLQNLTLAKLEEYRLELSSLLTSVEAQIRASTAFNDSSASSEDYENAANVTSTSTTTQLPSSNFTTPESIPFRDLVSPFPLLNATGEGHASTSTSPGTTAPSAELTTTTAPLPTESVTESSSFETTISASSLGTTMTRVAPSSEPATSTSITPISNATSPLPSTTLTPPGASDATSPAGAWSSTTAPPPNATEAAAERKVPKVKTFKISRKKRPKERRRGFGRGLRGPCSRLSQDELVAKLKAQGTYNPDYMAWDVPGVIRFLETATLGSYEEAEAPPLEATGDVLEKNLGALERILKELDVPCDVRGPETVARLYNITHEAEKSKKDSKETSREKDRLRVRRSAAEEAAAEFASALYRDAPLGKRRGVIGQVHTVPFGCSKRGSSEEGFLRLCGVCQAIRRLPDTFFPPFINEVLWAQVLCDSDKACLYFYDSAHGKCKQKRMNFVVLRNVGTTRCQLWRKFNLRVRVSCECFVDRMSFFAKYV